jgi:hypothetical protein
MMEPYVFHCTPCGKPHAGECPPKNPCAEIDFPTKITMPAIVSMGSRWWRELQYPGDPRWLRARDVFVVTEHVRAANGRIRGVRLDYEDLKLRSGGRPYESPPQAWTAAGGDFGTGRRIRYLPA